MDVQEAIAYIEAASWSKWRLGLERMRELLYRLGEPQKNLKYVHVAGTNGKGSTCAMVESVLRSAGYRAGFYSSPVIEDFRERIQINGEWIAEEALCRLTDLVRKTADVMESHPSQFEMVTAIGLLYFMEKHCDIVVLEAGLGGLYDATNVIDAPEVAVITNIDLDHTDYLGTTRAEIAENKAGIIKPGADVIAYPGRSEVLSVIRQKCEENGCSLNVADFSRLQPLSHELTGQSFLWSKKKSAIDEKDVSQQMEFQLPLIGTYQLHNAAVALTVIEVLQTRGWNISEEAMRAGMANVFWPVRFEVLRQHPLFILDGGHNRQCAEAAEQSLRSFLPGIMPVLLIGMLADKDYSGALDVLLPLVGDCICVTPSNDRALPAPELAKIIQKKGHHAAVAASVPEALEWCDLTGEPVFAFGSLYLAGEIRKNGFCLNKTISRTY